MALLGFREETVLEENQLEKLRMKRVKKFKNGKAAAKDEVTGELVKGGSDVVVDSIWKLCNMTFESGDVPKDLRFSVIVPLHKGKGERTECKTYRSISLLSVDGKIYAWILVDRVRSVTGGFIEDEQGGFRAEKGCVDQIFTLKQIGEKAREKM